MTLVPALIFRQVVFEVVVRVLDGAYLVDVVDEIPFENSLS